MRQWADLGLLLLPAAIYCIVPSFAELVVYLAVALPLYVWITRRWVRAVVIAAVFAGVGAIYVWNRIGTGYYSFINGLIYDTLTSAGWGGQGIAGIAVEKRLPYPYTDLFPVYLIQSFGWAGGLLLLVLVCWFALRMIAYTRSVSDAYGRALIFALSLMLAIRLIYGLSILTGRMPLISIPFPFLSYGQHVFIEFAALGLLMGSTGGRIWSLRHKFPLDAGRLPGQHVYWS